MAKGAIAAALEANSGLIADAFAGSAKQISVSLTFGSPIGDVLSRGAAGTVLGYTATVVLRLTNQNSLGWYIHTAYVH